MFSAGKVVESHHSDEGIGTILGITEVGAQTASHIECSREEWACSLARRGREVVGLAQHKADCSDSYTVEQKWSVAPLEGHVVPVSGGVQRLQ